MQTNEPASDAERPTTLPELQVPVGTREVINSKGHGLNRVALINVRLPVEILRQIFLRCVEIYVWPPHPELRPFALTHSQRYTALFLSQVCHSWRGITLSYPQLWKEIVMTNASFHQENPTVLVSAKVLARRLEARQTSWRSLGAVL